MKIAVVSRGTSWGSVNPATLRAGLGGRETAAVQLALNWAALGHDVTVFASNAGASHQQHDSGGQVSFVDTVYAKPCLTGFPFDVVLSWEDPALFSLEQIKQWGALTVCGMQVAHVPPESPEVLALPDCWVALSSWAADFLGTQLPDQTRITILPNCIDPDLFEAEPARFTRDRDEPLRFLYASSPDRGLHHVLRMWPRIRAAYPGARLDVVYGAKDWANANLWQHYRNGDIAAEILDRIDQAQVFDHGKVGQDVVSKLHYASDFLLYPCDPSQETETGCITVLEAIAGGNYPVLTDADCLPTEFSGMATIVPLPVRDDAFLAALDDDVHDPDRVNETLWLARQWLMRERTWPVVAERWIEMFESLRVEVGATA